MNFEEVWVTLWTYVILPAIPIVGGMLIVLLNGKLKELQTKIQTDKLNKYINLAGDAVLQAVESVYQTYVESLKKNGKFDKESQKKAFEEALRISSALITQDAREIIGVAYGDFDKWLETKIEQMVKWNKE